MIEISATSIADGSRRQPHRLAVERDVARGLKALETDDVLVLFAAAPGQLASDGQGANSPFAAALARRLPEPGLPVQLLGGRVRDDVLGETGGAQRPYVNASITGEPFYLVPAAAPAAGPAPAPPPPAAKSAAAEVVRICREVEQMTSLVMLGVLERQHQGTPAVDCISARIGELKAAQTAEATERLRLAALKAESEARQRVSGTALTIAQRLPRVSHRNDRPSPRNPWTISCSDHRLRVLRGGSWYVSPAGLRSAGRGRNTTGLRSGATSSASVSGGPCSVDPFIATHCARPHEIWYGSRSSLSCCFRIPLTKSRSQNIDVLI
jgi:hypothetical protein